MSEQAGLERNILKYEVEKMKKRTLTLGLTLLTVLATAAPAYADSGFADIAGHEDAAVIEKWCDYGIVEGYGGNFRPDDAVTESELDIMLDRLMGREVSAWSKSGGLSYGQAEAMLKEDFVNYSFTGSESGELTRAGAVTYLEELVGPVDTVYDHAYIGALDGGFTDTIEAYAQAEGWTVEEFNQICQLPASSMSAIQLTSMNKIRDKQLKPKADTLVQKVITEYDVNKYLDGSYQTPKGFISICADVKQYVTVKDCYYGLRLDYAGTYFKPDDPYYGVIRFTADNSAEATVPKSPANGGAVEDPYPFGGAGFTTGTAGRMGSPEWVLPVFAQINAGGAQLLLIAEDGTETVKGVYNDYAGRFLNLTIEP